MTRIAGTILAALAGMLLGRLLEVGLKSGDSPDSQDEPPRHGFRFFLVETTLGIIWGLLAWRLLGLLMPAESALGFIVPKVNAAYTAGLMILTFALVGLSRIECHEEQRSLADLVTLPGIAIGCVFSVFLSDRMERLMVSDPDTLGEFRERIFAAVFAAAIVLLVRWLCRLTRRLEVVGWGEAHLMAMLGAWLGLQGALLAFVIGVLIGLSLLAALWLIPRTWRLKHRQFLAPVPLGALVCTGGILSCLWGPQILMLALRWSVLPKLALRLP